MYKSKSYLAPSKSTADSLDSTMVENPLANAGDARDEGLIPGLGRFTGGETATHSGILAWDPMDRRAWRATVHGGHKELNTTE